MTKPLQTFQSEPIHVDGQNQATELHQHQHGWEAVCPALELKVEADGPNQARKKLAEKVRER